MPLPFMTLRSLRTAAALTLLAAPLFLSAQEISASEEERLEALARADAEVYVPKTNVTVGFRMLASGGRVHFGNLGVVPFTTTIDLTTTAVNRNYNNGYVNADTARAAESTPEGIQTSTPGGRYLATSTDADGNVTVAGDFISYTPGLTRSWSYSTPDQATAKPGYIAMSSYSATSDGGFKDAKQGLSGGVEMQYSKVLGKLGKRVDWGLTAGIGLNSINGKASGTVTATLHTNTDYYSLNGQTAPATSTDTPFAGPTYTDLLDSNGNVLVASGYETTPTLSANPTSSDSTSVVGGALVTGNWQVKGAYFMVKLGPSVHAQLTERVGVTASLGLAGAYAGTQYSAVESFTIPNMTTTVDNVLTSSYTQKFLGGYYGDLSVEWAANERTGLYGGLTAQKFGDYEQTVTGRTAIIDLGSSVGIRGGFSFKF